MQPTGAGVHKSSPEKGMASSDQLTAVDIGEVTYPLFRRTSPTRTLQVNEADTLTHLTISQTLKPPRKSSAFSDEAEVVLSSKDDSVIPLLL